MRTRRTPYSPSPMPDVRNHGDAIRLLLGLRRALDDAIRDDATDGYHCTQALNQLHRELASGDIDIAQVCGILGVFEAPS